VNKSKGETQRIRNGGGALRTAGVGADDDSIPVILNVVLDVLLEQRASVQVVN